MPLDKPTAGHGATGGHSAGTDGETESDTGRADSREVTEAALFEAFGGVRGLVETTVPGLVFITLYTVFKDIHTSALVALGLAVAMGLFRLVRRDTLKHAFSGIFGVAFGVLFAMMTGNAKDFYLPGMLYTLGLALAYIITSMAGVPLLGVVLGPVFKENLSWRTRNPGRKRAYVKASYAWGFILLAKSAILFPLYWWGATAQFGWVTVALKIPPFLLAVYLTWIFLAKAPAPINVIAEMEAEEKAAKEAEQTPDAARAGRDGSIPAGPDSSTDAAPAMFAEREAGRPGGRHRR